MKARGAQEVVINFELFTRAKLLCGRGRHVKVGGAQARSAPVPTPMSVHEKYANKTLTPKTKNIYYFNTQKLLYSTYNVC